METNRNKEEFLFPHSSYRGQVKPENLVFNSNLQEFAQRVNYICNLETNGKITPVEAYEQIKNLWQELQMTKQSLGIGQDPFTEDIDEENF